jgi:predicted RNase H-like HicB family nuclease
MNSRKTYEVTATRSGGWWALDVPELFGVHSQARRLDQAEDAIRDAIAFALEIPDDSFDVTFAVQADPASDEIVQLARIVRDDAERAEGEARDVTVAAIAHLKEHGYTQRDVGQLLGLSYQRVQQIQSQLAAAERRDAAARPPEAVLRDLQQRVDAVQSQIRRMLDEGRVRARDARGGRVAGRR